MMSLEPQLRAGNAAGEAKHSLIIIFRIGAGSFTCFYRQIDPAIISMERKTEPGADKLFCYCMTGEIVIGQNGIIITKPVGNAAVVIGQGGVGILVFEAGAHPPVIFKFIIADLVVILP